MSFADESVKLLSRGWSLWLDTLLTFDLPLRLRRGFTLEIGRIILRRPLTSWLNLRLVRFDYARWRGRLLDLLGRLQCLRLCEFDGSYGLRRQSLRTSLVLGRPHDRSARPLLLLVAGRQRVALLPVRISFQIFFLFFTARHLVVRLQRVRAPRLECTRNPDAFD